MAGSRLRVEEKVPEMMVFNLRPECRPSARRVDQAKGPFGS